MTVERPVTATFLAMMAAGVRIGGEKTKPCVVTKAGPATFRIVLTQGLNRQIRRMCEYFDYKVTSLQRVRIITLTLEGLKTGQWRKLKMAEVRALLPHKGPDFNF